MPHAEDKLHKHKKHHEEECGCCSDEKETENGDCDGCSCGHDHGGEGEENRLLFVTRIGIAAVLAAVAAYAPVPAILSISLYIIAYFSAGFEVLSLAFRNLFKGHMLDENFLMLIATAGAFAVQKYEEAVAVMLFYGIGELLQGLAVSRSRRSISKLMDLRPETAALKTPDGVKAVKPEEIQVGDTIVVRAGERLPLDGVILSGSSFLDTSALTGESVPREAFPGDEVLSGCINQTGLIEIKVTRPSGESAVSRILELAENAASRKSKTERFLTVFAKYYTPAVVGAAALTAVLPPVFLGFDTFSVWLYRALIFLVVSCPCALVISIPLTYFAGIGGASKQGILVKGADSLDALYRTKTIVFDKTGTLTKGVFNVTAVLPAEGFDKERLLKLAAAAESGSNHPVAGAIVKAAGSELPSASNHQEAAGKGVAADTPEGAVLAGNAKWMAENGISVPECDATGTIVYISVHSKYAGTIVVSDEIKESAKEAITSLRALGIPQTAMLTGDGEKAAKQIASAVGITHVRAGLLPDGKVAAFEELMSADGGTAFVGDGINDAPVLARADVGIAMGGLGSDAAIEAADLVLMNDDPGKIAAAVRVARKTRKLVLQNVALSLGVKAVVLGLTLTGFSSMWMAVFADTGVALLAVLNALRALKHS